MRRWSLCVPFGGMVNIPKRKPPSAGKYVSNDGGDPPSGNRGDVSEPQIWWNLNPGSTSGSVASILSSDRMTAFPRSSCPVKTHLLVSISLPPHKGERHRTGDYLARTRV